MLEMEDRCKASEPKVINSALIERCIEEQGPPGEAGRLAREEGIPLDEVEQIRIEYFNILRIDHLWMLTALTKLSLANNLIEKIENLEALVNLKELDLSFNKIEKIENLDDLVNLEILSLFENLISKLENMDTLKKLTIFTIGRNRIVDRSNVCYLRRFLELKSLNMAGNPCAEASDFVRFIATFLPRLVYYQYRILSASEREIGKEQFSDELMGLLKEEAQMKEIQDKIEAELAEAELHAGSFVEFLGSSHLFDSLFENDEDGNAFLKMGKDVEEFYDEYKEKFVVVCQQIFEIGQVQYQLRKVEVDQFFESVNSAKKTAQYESIEKMEEFLVQKAEIFKRMKKLEESLKANPEKEVEFQEQIQKCADDYSDLLHKTWKDLMGLELTLYEQMEEVIATFEQTLTEMINNFIETSQGYFTEMRGLEQGYLDNITNEATAMLTLVTADEEYPVPGELQIIMSDKEFLNNALGASHDVHLQLIDAREDRLVGKARTWLNNVVSGLQRDEITRNRSKILEVNHFLDIQREEFDELHASSIEATLLDPDLTAALI